MNTNGEVAVWVRYTVEVSTSHGEIRRTFNNINPFLMAVNDLVERGLLEKPRVKVLEPRTCGGELTDREINWP